MAMRRFNPRLFVHAVTFLAPVRERVKHGKGDYTYPGPGIPLDEVLVQAVGGVSTEDIAGGSVGVISWNILVHHEDLTALGLTGSEGITTDWRAEWAAPELHTLRVKAKPIPRRSGLSVIACDEVG